MNKIAIHHRKSSFSKEWIKFCKDNGVSFKIVNCYETDIMDQLHDCDALMWHFHHSDCKDFLFAKKLIYSVQKTGKIVFPGFNEAWHFDDKIGQKYLLESLGLPLVPTYIFYDKKTALNWIDNAEFPKIFKLRNGASSEHVEFVKNKSIARKLIKQAFGQGFKQYDPKSKLKERLRQFKKGDTNFWSLIKGILRFFYPTDFSRVAGNEKGYIYFQDFIPGKDHDIRVVVIADKAFAIKRMVRENDFRASGSGTKYMDKDLFSDDTIKLAFKIAKNIKSNCIAIDFIFDGENPKILELSYGFRIREVFGYWDCDLKWHDKTAKPQNWMVENVLQSIGI